MTEINPVCAREIQRRGQSLEAQPESKREAESGAEAKAGPRA
jgi:hypothetical protein